MIDNEFLTTAHGCEIDSPGSSSSREPKFPVPISGEAQSHKRCVSADSVSANGQQHTLAIGNQICMGDDSDMNLTLFSERLALNPITPDDLGLCLEMFTDPEVVKYAGGLMTPAEIREKLPDWTRRGGDGCVGIWCISNRETGEKYGTTALLPMPIEEDHTDFSQVTPGKMPGCDIEIGYFLKRSAWGRGYASEASRRLLDFAFQETPLKEVVATIDKENVASRNVLLKAGFADRGTMHCYGKDGPIYRITRGEWLASQNRHE